MSRDAGSNMTDALEDILYSGAPCPMSWID